MTEPISTNERLALALEELTNPPAPNRMIRRARRGLYSDFQSDSDNPKQDLFIELTELGQPDFATRVVSDEFRDTVAESRDFLRSGEGFRMLRAVFPAITRERWKDIIPHG